MRKNLARAIVLGLVSASVCSVASAAQIQRPDIAGAAEEAVSISTFKPLNVTEGDYKVNLKSEAAAGAELRAMDIPGSIEKANLGDVVIDMKGKVSYQARGLYIGSEEPHSSSNTKITINNYIQENDLECGLSYADDKPLYNANATAMYVSMESEVTVTGTTYINSIIKAVDGTEKILSAAQNGIYAEDNSLINLEGTTYINTNISNFEEVYDGDYKSRRSKNDAVTGKSGSVVNINVKGGNTVQLLGNLDVKGRGSDGGTINVRLDTADSFWHGEEVNYNWSPTKGTGKDKSDLNVTLANGAQWVPDKEITSISKITLKENGIINLHGFNEHVHYPMGFTKNLTIGNLTTNGGIFRMDVNAEAAGEDGRNGSDFVSIQSGTGIAYVQPVLENKNDLSKITRQNAVWFSDAAKGIEFKPYLKVEEIEKGFLYDYKPIVDKNVKDTDISKYDGNNWYLVGIAAQNTPTTETAIGAATVDYATATARLEIDSLNKRLGELRNYDTAEKGAWVRFKGGEMRGSDDTYFKNKYRFYQIGYDAKENTNEQEDGRWHKGFAIHYTDGESSYLNGKGENDSRGISLYAGWEGNKGHYADYVLKYSHLHNDFTAYGIDGTADGDFSNYAISASAEYGRKNLMKHDWIFEPQAQLVYTYLSGADYITSNNISVDMDSTNSLIGRAGFRIGREYDQDIPEKRSKWYLKADILHEFCGDRDINMLSADGSQTLNKDINGHDTWLVWGFGGDIALDKDSYFYCDFERSAGGDINTKWQANIGLRWEW